MSSNACRTVRPRAGSTSSSTCSAAVHCCRCPSSPSASCRTSRPASSSSCSGWSFPASSSCTRRAPSGQSKLTQYTRYLTIALGLLNATTLVSLARSGQLLPNCQLPIIPDDIDRHHGPDHHHADGRHRPDHVDGRARDRKGRRQRHVPADLHVHRGRLPGLARRHLEGPGPGHVLPGPGHRPADRGRWWSSWSSPSAASRCSTPSA